MRYRLVYNNTNTYCPYKIEYITDEASDPFRKSADLWYNYSTYTSLREAMTALTGLSPNGVVIAYSVDI